MKVNYWQKFEENSWYHIYNRGIDRCKIYSSAENKRYFLQKFNQYLGPYFEVGAYCLLSNHFHFMLRVKPIDENTLVYISEEETRKSDAFLNGELAYHTFLEYQFKRFLSAYALAFNKQEGRVGSLLQKRFKRLKIHSILKLMYTLAYIHHNPVHHGYCDHPSKWTYSSYRAFFSQGKTSIPRDEVLSWFQGNTRQEQLAKFRAYHTNFERTKP